MTNPTDPRVEAACLEFWGADDWGRYSFLQQRARKRKVASALKAADKAAWQPIESAPTGANGIAWMQLAKIDGEETFTWSGMHCRGKFYAAGVFHKGGDVPYEFRQQEVQPTHWRPEQAPPETKK